MRFHLVAVLMCLIGAAPYLGAQGPTVGRVLDCGGMCPEDVPVGRGAGPLNPYVIAGAQLGYRIGGNSDFGTDMIASGRVQTPVWPTLFKPGSRWGLTAIGNFSKLVPKEFKKPQDYKKQGEELLSSAEGVNAAVYWHRVSRTQKERFETLANDSSRTPGDTAPVPEGWTTTFWPIAPAYKINAVTDSGGAGTIDDATRYVQQVRVGFVGFEFVKHPAQSYASVTGGDADTEAAQPFTISVEGVFTQCFTHLDLCKDLFGSGATGRVSAELTTVIPVFRRIPHLERIPLFGPTLKASPVLVQIAVAPNQRALYRVNLLVLK